MNKPQQRTCKQSQREAGQNVVLFAFLIVALIGFLVLVTDVGYMYYTKRDLQGIVDAATMAGARRTPAPVDTAAEKWEAVKNATREALGCYARNIGLDSGSVPQSYSTTDFDPDWDGGSGTNYRYTTTIGGDEVSVTVFYQDAISQAQDIAKEMCVRVDARRNTSMFFAGVLGFHNVDVTAAAAGYRGIFKVTWTFRTYGGDVHATPFYYVDPYAGNREVVYVGCRDGYLYCLNALGKQDGSKKTHAWWRFRPATDGTGTTYGWTEESTSTGENNRWPMVQGQVRVLNRNGKTLIYFITVPGDGGTSSKGYLYCLDGSTGQRIWSKNIQAPGYHKGVYGESYVDSRPAFSSDNEVVYVGSRGGYLYAFDVDDGTPVSGGSWSSGRVQLFGGTNVNPWVETRTDQDAINHGLGGRSDIIYMACSQPKDGCGSGGSATYGMVYAFYSNGQVKWSSKISSSNNFEGFDGSPVIYGDTLYIGCRDGKLYAVNKETGAVKWSYAANYALSCTPAIEEVGGNRYVYFSSEKATAYKLLDQGTSASLVWSITLGMKQPDTTYPNRAAWHCSPALATDYVYFGCQTHSGSVYGDQGRGYFEAISKVGGQSDQQYQLDADLHSNMEVAANNWVYFGGCDNLVYGVDLNPANQESKLLW